MIKFDIYSAISMSPNIPCGLDILLLFYINSSYAIDGINNHK